MNNPKITIQIDDQTTKAVVHYWKTRATQRQKQETGGKADQGLRSAVTGGAQMDGIPRASIPCQPTAVSRVLLYA